MNLRWQSVLRVVPFFLGISSASFIGCNDEQIDQRVEAVVVSDTRPRGDSARDYPKGKGGSDEREDDTDRDLSPPVDYAAPGPFDDAVMIENTGPGGDYTLFRPGASLGRNGFKHPIVSWGNGIITVPTAYETTLRFIATHGFVVIASNSRKPEGPLLKAGLDWLTQQNVSEGALKGKLDTSREATIGYSWGGGAAIDAADRPNVRCTISLQGMPPRGSDAFDTMHHPLLLITSTSDGVVPPSKYVTPNFQKSKVQTFYATLDDSTAGHLYIVDEGSFYCLASILIGPCRSAKVARAPMLAWLRMWVYGDREARKFFYGDDCILCKSPWTDPRRKLWN